MKNGVKTKEIPEKWKKKMEEIPKENLRFSKNGRPYDKEKLKEKIEKDKYKSYYRKLKECRKHIPDEEQ